MKLSVAALLYALLISDNALANSSCQTLAVPSYSYPGMQGNFWDAAAEAPRGSIYILNPASGSGTSIDVNYLKALEKARKAGIQILGYVDTAYGQRTLASIAKEVIFHKQHYRVSGIFLDQTTLDEAHLNYYSKLAAYIHTQRLTVAFNPGQPQIDKRYFTMADSIINFEGTYDAYKNTAFPKWITEIPTQKIWHLVHSAPAEQDMQKAIALSRRNHAGLVYITDDTMPNPWDLKASYWEKEAGLLCVK